MWQAARCVADFGVLLQRALGNYARDAHPQADGVHPPAQADGEPLLTVDAPTRRAVL